MLQKFSVENFKGFKEKITLDIGSPNNYNFNSELIEKGCVNYEIITLPAGENIRKAGSCR